MMTKQLNRSLCRSSSHLLLGVAISIVSVACSNRLKAYTQVTMQASAPNSDTKASDPKANDPKAINTEASNTEISADSLTRTQEILENRLSGLGVELAEIEAVEPDQIVVRLPPSINVKAAESLLTNTGQLYLRNQKAGTEKNLAKGIEDLQRLLVEQNTLSQLGKQAEADALQPQVEDARKALSGLFEPSEITGDQLYDAKARPSKRDRNIWEVTIQFDKSGADKFAQQTKLMAGTGRAVGLFLDDVLLSTPVVDVAYAQTGITEGIALISGNFTESAAKELAIQLKSGALPVKLNTVEVTSIGMETQN